MNTPGRQWGRATSKERKETRERQSKKQRPGTGTESQESTNTKEKKREQAKQKTYIGRTDASLASLSLLFVFPMEPSLR
jgi:hypothetical protein